VEIAIVLEHKSHRDNRAKEQLLHEWLHLRQKRRRIPIVPVIFYHGARLWQPMSFQDEVSKLPQAVIALQPHMPVVFVDLCRQKDEILSNPTLDGMSRLALYLLKKCPLALLRVEVLHGLLENASKSGTSAQLGESWKYLSGRGGLDLPTYENLATAFVEEPIMRTKSTLEQMYDKALGEGLEQGLEQGYALRDIEHVESMLAKGFGWEQIESILKVSEAMYLDLKKKLSPSTTPYTG
jgi:hypothetical protein